MKYIIDIDGTICENGSCESCKYEGSTPIKERIDVINQLINDETYKLITMLQRISNLKSYNAEFTINK